MNDFVNVPSSLAKEIAKFIRLNDNGNNEAWAEMLDPKSFYDKVYKIINFYIKSDGDPSDACNEIISEFVNLINDARVIENIFIVKSDLIGLIENV